MFLDVMWEILNVFNLCWANNKISDISYIFVV